MAYISFQPQDYFNTKLYTGNGSTQSITGVGFQPDWVWTKERSGVCDHHIFDVLRGATYKINSASTETSSADANTLTSFDSDGFSVGTNPCQNNNTDTYVSWNWKANGTGSSNTDGTINTTYTSANTTSGFSISTYTGTGSAGTIGHGLGVAPAMIIVKRLTGSAEAWTVYHQSLDASAPQDKYLHLNSTDAVMDSAGMWNDTAPTTSVFSVGSTGVTNGSGGTFVAYCFAEKQGFSKFGSYTGNGNADGSFIYTGFSPAFVIVKQTNASGESWKMYDNKRPGYNLVNNWLEPDDSQAEGTGSNQIDMVSNGFKARATNTAMNASGSTYIFMAFAEAPLVGSNNIPATAR